MKLIFLYGPPAVGKLTVAKELAKKLDLPLVDNHSVVNPLAKVFGWGHPEQKRLGGEFRLELFRSAAKFDKSLITTFGGGGEYYNEYIQQVRGAIEENGGEVIFVRLMAPKEVLFARVGDETRVAKFTIATEERLAETFERIPDVFAAALVGDHLEVDTSLHTPEESAEIIAEHIRAIKGE
jgi:shikimate kinase